MKKVFENPQKYYQMEVLFAGVTLGNNDKGRRYDFTIWERLI